MTARRRHSLFVSSEWERERLVEMSGRMRHFRQITFVILATAVALSAPWIGPWPLLPLVLAAGGFLAFDHFTPRMQRPEYGLAAAWLLAQVMIAASVALSGGPHSPAVGWLAIPVASLGARFSRRGVVVGSLVTAVLLLAATLGVHPREVWDDPPVVLGPLALIGSIAFIGGAIMESDLLHRSRSVLDGLTGMLNRRALATRAEELGAQARLTGQPVGLVLGDLDRFKLINDTCGHATGDAVLVDVAYVLRKELHAFDLAYRVGGEEFLVVIPGGDESEARTLAERLRVAVEAGGQRVMMSFGIASSGGGAFDFDALLARADAALYEAKAAGRNAVRGGGELVSSG